MSRALSRVSSLSSSKGTLYSVEYTSWKEEDILRELQADGVPVSHVYRFLDRRGSSPVGSPRLLLTFDVPHPPSHVYLGFTSLSVRHFIPRPRRCFRCQLFGHSLRTCRRQATCSHCGKLPHRPCPNPPSCVNCGGPHPSDFSHCPSYLFEKTALEIQAVEKLTIQSARQRARELPYRDGLSYADVLDRRGSSPVASQKLITFDIPHPPSHVYLIFTRLSVRHFIPRPRRCFRCQIFGHSIRTFRQQATCSHFGKLPHRPCLNPPACVNSGGPHPSDSSHCPSYLF